jgi:hypothetical protein
MKGDSTFQKVRVYLCVSSRKESECSPRPYKQGFCGSWVRRRTYCDSKINVAPDVSKSTWSDPLRLTLKEKELSIRENSRPAPDEETALFFGRGRTDSWTW